MIPSELCFLKKFVCSDIFSSRFDIRFDALISNFDSISENRFSTSFLYDSYLNNMFSIWYELSPQMIKELTNIEETASILQKNYYAWFVRIRRGLYALSDEARLYLEKYKEKI